MQKQFDAIIDKALAIVQKGLVARHEYRAAIEEAKPFCKGKTWEEVRDYLTLRVATFHDVPRFDTKDAKAKSGLCLPLVPGERKAKGRMVLDSTKPAYQAAKRDLTRIVTDICGPYNGDKAPSEPTKQKASADEKAAARALLKACKGDLARAKAILAAVA